MSALKQLKSCFHTDLTAADWLLVADGVPVDTTALEHSGIPCPDGYTLYRNPTPGLVAFLV